MVVLEKQIFQFKILLVLLVVIAFLTQSCAIFFKTTPNYEEQNLNYLVEDLEYAIITISKANDYYMSDNAGVIAKSIELLEEKDYLMLDQQLKDYFEFAIIAGDGDAIEIKAISKKDSPFGKGEYLVYRVSNQEVSGTLLKYKK
jgi:hypothetical protein